MSKVLILDAEGLDHRVEFEIYSENEIEYLWVKGKEELHNIIEKYKDEIKALVAQVNFKVDETLINKLPNLKGICTFGIGFNHVDLAAASKRNITVSNVPDYSITEVADHTITLALNCIRNIKNFNRLVESNTWESTLSFPIKRLNTVTFGLIGFGRIAQEVAKRLAGFGVNIIAYDKYVKKEIFTQLNVTEVELNDIFSQSDVISLHVPLTEETKNLINDETIHLMEKKPIIINTSRGGTIDEIALFKGLENHQISGAAIDVLSQEPPSKDHPLIGHDRVIITPHVAYLSNEAVKELQYKTAQNIVKIINNQIPDYIVNN